MSAENHQPPALGGSTAVQFLPPTLVPQLHQEAPASVSKVAVTPFTAPLLPLDAALPHASTSDTARVLPELQSHSRGDVKDPRKKDGGSGSGPSGERLPLRPHQDEALAEVVEAFATETRATVVMPPGSGKTVLSAAVACRFASGGRVLVVVPTLHLIGQSAAAWARFAGKDATEAVLGICSDPQQLMHTGLSAAVLVSTQPRDLAKMLQDKPSVWAFATYQSLWALRSAHRDHGGIPAFDLIVVDEAHHTVGSVGKPWATVNDDANIPGRLRLYTTATPRTTAVERADVDLVAMDDATVYGREVYHLPVANAVARDVVADFRVVVPVTVTAPAARALAGGTDDEHPGGVSPDMAAMVAALFDAHRQYGMCRVISFHSRVDDCQLFARAVTEQARAEGLNVFAQPIHGAQPLPVRKRLLEQLADGGDRDLTLLASVRVLGEGVDVPEVDGIVFAHRKTSMVDIVQALGRALRAHIPDKVATVLIPMIVDGGAGPKQVAMEAACERLSQTLLALKEYDHRIEQQLTSVATRVLWPSDDAPAVTASDRVVLHGADADLLATLARGVRVRMLADAGTTPWRRGFEAAARYYAAYGNLDVPIGFIDEHGVALRQWLDFRRFQRRQGKESPDHIALLDELGMVWQPKHVERFSTGLAEARAWRDHYGNLEVPRDYVTASGFALGEWISNLRHRRNTGRLDARRAADLEALGMVWRIDMEARNAAMRDASWLKGVAALRAYVAEHGDALVPVACVTEDGVNLGLWITYRRTEYKAGTLTPDRIQILEGLGMVWQFATERFQVGLEHAATYHAAHGDLQVPRGYVSDDDYPLGQWLATMRKQKSQLSADQIKALDALGMTWAVHDARWQRGLAHAIAHKKATGNLDISGSFVCDDGYKLGEWLKTQRAKLRTGELTEARLAALHELGLEPDPPSREALRRARAGKAANQAAIQRCPTK